MSKAGAKAAAEAKLKELPEDDELAEQFFQQLHDRVNRKLQEVAQHAPGVLRDPSAGRLDYFLNFLMSEEILTRRQLIKFEVSFLQTYEQELDQVAEEVNKALEKQKQQGKLQVAKKDTRLLGPNGQVIGGE